MKRQLSGKMAKIPTCVSVAFVLYNLSYLSGLLNFMGIFIFPGSHNAIALSYILTMSFLLFPATERSPKNTLPWYDLICILLAIVVNFYMVFNFVAIVKASLPTTILQQIFGTILVILVLEGCRRTVSWILSVLGFFFFIYPLAANFLPGILASAPCSYQRLIGQIYLADNGIYGSVMHMVATLITAFIIFGGFLEASGAGNFFINLALALLGRYRGGAAKTSVLASAFFGTISGSALANVATTGTLTIPLMKKAGFKPYFAAAVEAVSSNGGPIMPPVMGAVIFVMMDFLGISYLTIMGAVVLPACLYYLGELLMVDLEAARTGLRGLPREQLPRLIGVLKSGWFFVLPFAVLIYLLVVREYSPGTACMYALASLVIASVLFSKKERMGVGKAITAMESVAKGMPQIGAAVGIAGILIASLGITGLSFKLSTMILYLSGGNLIVLLLLAAGLSWLMGMGLPAIAVYIVTGILIAPSLVMMDIPPIAAHLFCLYFGLSALITPPICAAAYVAAAIAEAPLMRTGVEAMRIGILLYIIPFAFIYDQAILGTGSIGRIALAVVTCISGVYFLACGLQGYFLKSISWPVRILLLAGGLALFSKYWSVALLAFIAGSTPLLWQALQRQIMKKDLGRKMGHSF